MKFVDDRGRILGKINLIDFSALVFIFFLLPMIYFGYKIILKRSTLVPVDAIQTEVNCKFIKVSPSILKQISIGDKEVNEKGETIGEIIWLGEIKPYQYEFNLGSGQTATEEDLVLKEVSVKLRLKVEIKNNTLYYTPYQNVSFPITISIPFVFSTPKYTLKVLPAITKEISEGEPVETEVNCKFIKVSPSILKQISIGDKEVNEKGETIGEIIWLGEIKPYQYEFNLGSGQTATEEDLVLKEVSVKLRLKGTIKGNTLYYKNGQLLANFPFEFKSNDYSLQTIPAIISKKILDRWLKIQIKSSNVIPEVANILKEGDIQKDSNGRTVANLEGIIINKPSEILMMPRVGEWTVVTHPSQKDIVSDWNILCIEKDGVLYFNNYPVKIGNIVIFMTDLYSLSGTVVDMRIK